MKFVFDGSKMVATSVGYIGEKAKEGSVMDHINNFSDWVVQSEIDMIFKPILSLLAEGLSELGHWIVLNLPDIMGYGTLLAGAWCMVGALAGKGGMMRPLGILAGGLIIAVCILGGV